jgi:prophage regulatory protein
MQTDRILREPEVRQISGLSRVTRWRQERKGKFPARRKLSDNAVGWLESEIRDWVATRSVSRQPTGMSHVALEKQCTQRAPLVAHHRELIPQEGDTRCQNKQIPPGEQLELELTTNKPRGDCLSPKI